MLELPDDIKALADQQANNELPEKKDIKNDAELKRVLRQAGQEWYEQNTEITKQGREIPPKVSPNAIARIINQYAHLALIGIDPDKSPLAVYQHDKGLYTTSVTYFHRLIKLVDSRTMKRQSEETQFQLRLLANNRESFASPTLIPVNNGIFDLETKELRHFSPEYVITSKIATSYNFNATKPNIKGFDFDAWLASIACGDKEVITLLWQVINEAINPCRTRGKIGFLIGDGNNGKGTFQALLTNLIGQDNIASLKPGHFAERFYTSNLVGKVANIGDDISNKYIDEISDLMSIATGDPIEVEEKGKASYSVQLQTFCLFSGNEMPSVRNKSHGWYRRLLLIPFNADFTGQKENPRIKQEYLKDKRVLEYVLKQALELEFDKFIEPKVVTEAIKEYKTDNDFIREFIVDEYIPNGYHLLEKVPATFIKSRLQVFKGGSNSDRMPRGIYDKFTKTAGEETGNTYKYGSARFNGSEELPDEIKAWVNLLGRPVAKAIILISDPLPEA